MTLLLSAAPARAGVIVRAACSACGYQSAPLPIFAGKADFRQSCRFPAACPDSGQVVLQDILNPDRTQPPCPPDRIVPYSEGGAPGGRVIASWTIPGRNRRVVLTDADYPCPRCGHQALRFRRAGNWD